MKKYQKHFGSVFVMALLILAFGFTLYPSPAYARCDAKGNNCRVGYLCIKPGTRKAPENKEKGMCVSSKSLRLDDHSIKLLKCWYRYEHPSHTGVLDVPYYWDANSASMIISPLNDFCDFTNDSGDCQPNWIEQYCSVDGEPGEVRALMFNPETENSFLCRYKLATDSSRWLRMDNCDVTDGILTRLTNVLYWNSFTVKVSFIPHNIAQNYYPNSYMFVKDTRSRHILDAKSGTETTINEAHVLSGKFKLSYRLKTDYPSIEQDRLYIEYEDETNFKSEPGKYTYKAMITDNYNNVVKKFSVGCSNGGGVTNFKCFIPMDKIGDKLPGSDTYLYLLNADDYNNRDRIKIVAYLKHEDGSRPTAMITRKLLLKTAKRIRPVTNKAEPLAMQQDVFDGNVGKRKNIDPLNVDLINEPELTSEVATPFNGPFASKVFDENIQYVAGATPTNDAPNGSVPSGDNNNSGSGNEDENENGSESDGNNINSCALTTNSTSQASLVILITFITTISFMLFRRRRRNN